MTSERGITRLVGGTTLAAVLGVAGCLPFPRSWTVSPDLEGAYLRADGTPAAGAPVALSTEAADSTCTEPRARATTDASGRFAFAEVRHREAVTILLPIDRIFCYSVCAGETPVSRPAFSDCSFRDEPPPTGLDCREVPPDERAERGRPVVCTRRRLDDD
ncbi:MAG TPA: hypothetical protein VHG91_07675 [Longimicrobium sp.]|nr:hypothetical protein [Longimicrobium sp.]